MKPRPTKSRTPPELDSRVHLYEARASAAQGCPSAIRKLLWLMENGDSQDTQMRAAVHVLNWGLGKPRETVETEHKGEIILRDLQAERLAKKADAAS